MSKTKDEMIETLAEADQSTPDAAAKKRAAKRLGGLQELVNRGYKSGNEDRKIRTMAHADFLVRGDVVKLP